MSKPEFQEEMMVFGLWSETVAGNRLTLQIERNIANEDDAVLEMMVSLSEDEWVRTDKDDHEFDFILVDFTADEADAWGDALKRGAAEVRRLLAENTP